jgi:superfamily II DNA helicase RecQ
LATITNAQVEALARQLLWDQIDSTTWHAGLSEEERTASVKADVEARWHLRAGEETRLLIDRVVTCSVDQHRAS